MRKQLLSTVLACGFVLGIGASPALAKTKAKHHHKHKPKPTMTSTTTTSTSTTTTSTTTTTTQPAEPKIAYHGYGGAPHDSSERQGRDYQRNERNCQSYPGQTCAWVFFWLADDEPLETIPLDDLIPRLTLRQTVDDDTYKAGTSWSPVAITGYFEGPTYELGHHALSVEVRFDRPWRPFATAVAMYLDTVTGCPVA